MTRELIWVIDPDGVEKYLTQDEVDTLVYEEDAFYCQPDLPDDPMEPHYHKITNWDV